MDLLNATFEDYQVQYETFLPIELRKGLTYLQTHVHYAVTIIDESFPAVELVFRIIQVSVGILCFFPSLEPSLEAPKQFCKDVKNLTGVVKGLKSIDGLLNFKFVWKLIMLNVSGMTLFIVSALSLIERTQLLDVSAIKTYLRAIPIFGILPYGGLFSFSVMGLMGLTAFSALGKRSQLIEEENRIKNEKLTFWSQSLDLPEVRMQEQKYQMRVADLKMEITAYELLIKEGRDIEDEFNQRGDQTKEWYTCCQALKELNSTLKKKQTELEKYEEKCADWTELDRNWNQINPQELEDFRKAKQEKWEVKLNKIKSEKRSGLLAIVSQIIIFSKQALVIIGLATGYGMIALPGLINIGLETVVAGCGMTTFFMKRSIKKIQISPVRLTQYVNLAIS